jgi:hypothetical protein
MMQLKWKMLLNLLAVAYDDAVSSAAANDPAAVALGTG